MIIMMGTITSMESHFGDESGGGDHDPDSISTTVSMSSQRQQHKRANLRLPSLTGDNGALAGGRSRL